MSWLDMPEVAEQSPVVARVNIAGARMVEVRRTEDGRAYVTVGNLFGSQTLECADAWAALDAIGVIAKAAFRDKSGEQVKPPLRCVLMANREGAAS